MASGYLGEVQKMGDKEKWSPGRLFDETSTVLLNLLPSLVKGCRSDPQVQIQELEIRFRERNANFAKDGVTTKFVNQLSTLLAIYRRLSTELDSERALGIIQGLMFERYQPTLFLFARFGISQDVPEKAFELIKSNVEAVKEVFSKEFSPRVQVSDNSQVEWGYDYCFFHDFFCSNDSPEMLGVFCALDSIWMSELEKPKYGGLKCDHTPRSEKERLCRFRIRRARID
jgi:hypothetical protein